jgi:hypothetical protein
MMLLLFDVLLEERSARYMGVTKRNFLSPTRTVQWNYIGPMWTRCPVQIIPSDPN